MIARHQQRKRLGVEMRFGGESESQMAEKRLRPSGELQVGVSTGGRQGRGADLVLVSVMVPLRNPNVPRSP